MCTKNSCLSLLFAAGVVSPGGTSVPRSATEIPYWWFKICPESCQELLITNGSQMVKCKWAESTTKQSVFVEHSYSLKKKNHLSFVEACFRRTQNLSTIDQEKQKIQQIYIWNPFNHCQFNYVNSDFTSWVWNFCCLGTDIPPGKTSLAAILCRNSSNL